MSRTDEENFDLVSVSAYVSHEDKGHHKEVRSLLTQKNPTVDLTATLNSNHLLLSQILKM